MRPSEVLRMCAYWFLAVVLIVPAYFIIKQGIDKGNLGMIITGALLLLVGVLMAGGGKSLTETLVGRIGHLSEVGPKGAKFSEERVIVIGDNISMEHDVSKAYTPIDSQSIVKHLQNKLGVSEEKAKQVYDSFVSSFSEEEMVIAMEKKETTIDNIAKGFGNGILD